MLLRKLLDPDETARRRKLRAQIVRRNRIRRELVQGLEPKWYRRPPPIARTVHDNGWNPLEDGTAAVADQRRVENEGNALAFLVKAATPTGAYEGPSKDVARVGSPAVMDRIQHVPARFVNHSTATEDHRRTPDGSFSVDGQNTGSGNLRRFPGASGQGTGGRTALKYNDHVRMRWKDTLERILIQRHEDILRKDANRAWRQERLGLLLFRRKEYTAAREHLVQALTLGSRSSMCWRRLAQCHWFDYAARHDWDALWDAKAAFEQALRFVEMASNPYVLFEYARVLEWLGSYDMALEACASLLATFPRFAQRTTVMVRFVVLQRYQLLTAGETVDATDTERAIAKCVELTKLLLLDTDVVGSDQYPLVLYTHVRLNEHLYETAVKRGDGLGVAAKAAKASADVGTEELFKLAVSMGLASSSPGMTWKLWRLQSETYLRWADHFQGMNENIPAAEALTRALELMDTPLKIGRETLPSKTLADETVQRKIALYTAMATNYYESNQMERAIRAMETIFQLNPFLETVRQSLAVWFPAKWKDRIELEDASQVQIARVFRGLWGRTIAQKRRRELECQVDAMYKAHPYHPLYRRNVVRLLRPLYAPLFLAQDLAARRIQRAVHTYLSNARIRWKIQALHATTIRDVRAKYHSRKYRYHRVVRFQLAQLVPEEFDATFRSEDRAASLLQRWFRGERVRKAYRRRLAGIRLQQETKTTAASRIQRTYRSYRQHRENVGVVKTEQLLFETQRRLQHARERLAVQLQRLYRQWKNRLVLATRLHLRKLARDKQYECRSRSAAMIQRRWRRYVAHKHGNKPSSEASTLLDELRRGHERVLVEEAEAHRVEWEGSARTIQAAYRGRRARASLVKITRQSVASAASEITLLLDGIAQDHHASRTVVLAALDTVKAKRALFDFPVVVLRPDNPTASLLLDSVTAAIQHSRVLHTLVLEGGDFQSPRAETLFQSLRLSKTLRVLALGNVRLQSSNPRRSRRHSTLAVPEDVDDEGDDAGGDSDYSRGDNDEQDDASRVTPMRVLYETLRTTNFLLEQLLVDGNDLVAGQCRSDHNARWLARVVGDYFYGRYGKLRVLAAQRLQLSDTAAVPFGEALAINTVLQRLNLSGNLIRNAGAKAIAVSGLVANATLVSLNLADNAIGSLGATALFQSLETTNRTLRSLILTNNLVMNDAVTRVFKMLQVNAVIEEIDLRGNLIHTDHLDEMDRAMRERTATANDDLRLFLARRRLSQFTTHSGGQANGGRTTLLPVKRTGSKSKSKRHAAPLSPQKWLQAHATANGLVPSSLIQPPCVVLKEFVNHPSPKRTAAQADAHTSSGVVDALLCSSPTKKRQKPPHRKTTEIRLPMLLGSPPKASMRKGHCL